MLRYFLAAQVYGQNTSELFTGLKITELGDAYMRHQGQYPVIFRHTKYPKNRPSISRQTGYCTHGVFIFKQRKKNHNRRWFWRWGF